MMQMPNRNLNVVSQDQVGKDLSVLMHDDATATESKLNLQSENAIKETINQNAVSFTNEL